MNYQYNELNYAETIYRNGIQSISHLPTELRLTATYIRRVLNYKPKKLKEEMYHWAETNIPQYKKELYYKAINKAICQACKKGSILVNIENIDFYKYELDYINGLNIYDNLESTQESVFANDCKKLLFTLLFKMKINHELCLLKNPGSDSIQIGKYFKGTQRKYSELKKLANLSAKSKINEDIIHTLWINNIITPLNKGLIRLDFLDNMYKFAHTVSSKDLICVLQITNYDAVGLYLEYYNGNSKIAFCPECGTIFKKRSNRQSYCNELCSANADRQKAKERMARARMNCCSI